MRTFRRYLPPLGNLPTAAVLGCEAALVLAATGATGALLPVFTENELLVTHATPLLGMATAGLAALVGVLCYAIARLRDDEGVVASVAAAWAFYGLCVMPLGVVGGTTSNVTVRAAAFAAALAFLGLLAHAMTGSHLRWCTGVRGFTAAFAFPAAAVGAALLLPGAAASTFTTTAPGLAIGAGWLSLACGYILYGYLRRDRFYWRLGFGLGVVAAAHLNSFAFAATTTEFMALRLLGLLVLTAGLGRYASVRMREIRQAGAEEAERAATAAHAAARRDHEMRNALTNLAALPHLVTSGQDLPDHAGMARMLSAELSRLSGLLDDRPSRERENSAPVDLVLTRLATLRTAAGGDVTVDCQAGLVAGIPTPTLTQVMTNLLVNCDRYAPGSPVRITAQLAGERCLIRVTDSGPGIGRGPEAPGSGIGLALTTQLLARHGGTLTLLPAPGDAGCVAVLELPRPCARQGHGSLPFWRAEVAS